MSRPFEYRFCPRCAGNLELKIVKESEPQRLVCDRCGLVFYLDPKVATGAIIEMDGGVVLLKRGIEPAYGKWVVPGGFVDRYETVPDAVARETLEESGLTVRVGALVGVYSYPDSEVIILMYKAAYVSGTLSADDESIEAGLFPEDRIPWDDLAFPSTRDALRDYFKQKEAGKQTRR